MEQLSLIIWKTEYETGISVIDSQHQKLFDLYNAMVKQCNTHGTAGINTTIDALIKYTQQHFSYEESLMEKFGYSDRIDHMEEHSSFITEVMDLSYANSENRSIQTLTVFAGFLQDWLINHIMVVDRGYIDTISHNA